MSSGHCSYEHKCNTTTTPPYVILSVRPPNKLYTHLNEALLFRLICNTPIRIRGLRLNLRPFQRVDNEKHWNDHCSHVPFMLLAAILTRWRHPVASSKTLDLLHRGICAVLYRRTAAAIKTASFVSVFVDCCLFSCCPGGHWGNTERVVAQWRHPVASRVALDMPHWVMPPVLLRHTAVAIKTAGGWGTFAHCCLLFP